MEADLNTCPGIRNRLARSAQLSWVPPEITDPRSREEIMLIAHADIVGVVFDQYAREATYRGYIADGSPGMWADDLATAIEPCWKPARLSPPWLRSK